jgi:hypothetical protein
MTQTYVKPEHGWTCFHCGENFTTPGSARDHFGADPLAEPGCRIRAGEERGLLMALRRAEAELARYRNEDSDKDREFYRMQDEHRRALIREEEKGYARGLADARAEGKHLEKGRSRMNEYQIKHMVNRFLGWRLPADFRPDGGVSFKATFNEHTAHPMRHEPSGTNLLDATQAEAMVRYMVEGLPRAEPKGD